MGEPSSVAAGFGVATPERAIDRKDDDRLERSRFIERLTLALIRKDTGKSSGVVVGITGPWGSGKSSILNLLQEHIAASYPDAIVVRFDPWLVSGQTDLIAEFLAEVIGTLNSDERRKNQYRELGETIAEYGAHFASAADLAVPGAGAILSGALNAAKKALGQRGSLASLRAKLIALLRSVPFPVIVMIDEIDRVEDEEIRTVAQLVRSVGGLSRSVVRSRLRPRPSNPSPGSRQQRTR